MEHDGAARGWVEIHGDRIEGLYVAPASARAGIGTALMAQAEGRILAAGHTSAMLDASENAEPFYLARGYEPRGEILDDGSIPMRKAVEA